MSRGPLQQTLQQGISHHRAGRLAQALACYQRVRVAAPLDFDAWHLSGLVALQTEAVADAVAFLRRAVSLNAASGEAWMRLGLALIAAGQPAEAERCLRASIQITPESIEAWENLAYSLKAQDKLSEAVRCHEKVVALDPKRAASWFSLGLTWGLLGYNAEALQCHERAADADPKFHPAHLGRAQALQRMHRNAEAIQAYDRCLALSPQNLEARSNRLMALNYQEEWSREDLFREHVRYGEMLGGSRPPVFAPRPDPERRLRVAFLSPDLRTHSCAYFLEPLLRHLPTDQFEVFLYHDHFRTDEMSARLKARASRWRNFVGQANPRVETTIRSDGPDVLIDLAGHTGISHRLPLFARQLAPVQMTYLGYPNTTGVPAIQYRLTDAIADPVGEADAFATEKLVRFSATAWCYAPPIEAPPVSVLPALRGGGKITFGCFNTPAKLSPSLLATWGRLLAAVPEARLLLKGLGLGAAGPRDGFVAQLRRAGIDPARVELLERTDTTAQHLQLYARVDVALDTFPYNGTTTTCEALWMGCPVVTLLGDRHAARVSASLVSAVGHPEWIGRTQDEYVAIASGLVRDLDLLAAQRDRLRAEMKASLLLNYPFQAQQFGTAIRTAWCDRCRSAKTSG